MAGIHRDLADPRLWAASHYRSLERRRRAAGSSRRPVGPATGLAAAVTVTAVAVPALGGASPAFADNGGLAAVQRALGVKADGVMGPRTRAAIRRFQRRHHLPVVGEAGPRTRAALGLDGSEASAHAPRAATGTSVIEVQRHLGVDADGIVGPQTRAAIRSFQGDHSLPATGRLDGATRAAILQADPAATSDDQAASTSDPGSATPAAAPAPAAGVSAAVEAARAQIGKPYRSAGKG